MAKRRHKKHVFPPAPTSTTRHDDENDDDEAAKIAFSQKRKRKRWEVRNKPFPLFLSSHWLMDVMASREWNSPIFTT